MRNSVLPAGEGRGCGIYAAVLLLTLSLPGSSYCEVGSEDEISAYQKVLEVDPNNSKAYYNMGTAYLSHGDYPKALSALKKAIDLGEDSADAYFNLGLAHGNSAGPLEGAAKAFEQAVAIDPNYAKAHVHLGTIYETLGRYSEAEDNLKIAARLFRQQGMTEFAEQIEESLKSKTE